jgi:hypothetical protein
MFRSERYDFGIRGADRECASGGIDHRIHQPDGRWPRDRYDYDTIRILRTHRDYDPQYAFLQSELSHSAGIHADGIFKNEEIYNIFNTAKILNRPISVSINDKSGLAGIAQWMNSHFALTGKDRVEKSHPGVAKINRWVSKQYEEGRTTVISDQEMEKVAGSISRDFVPSSTSPRKAPTRWRPYQER